MSTITNTMEIAKPLTQQGKKLSPINKEDLGMAYHTPPLKKARKQGEMPLPSLRPSPLKNVEFSNSDSPGLPPH